MNKKTSGISLVALVITIIVLIILTAAVIVTFMDGGIIDRAREATFKNDITIYQEMLAQKKAENQLAIASGNAPKHDLNGTTAEQIKGFLPDFKDDYEGVIVVVDGEILLGSRMAKAEEDMTKEEKNYKEWLANLGIGEVGEIEEKAPNFVEDDWDYYLDGTDIVLMKYKGTATDVYVSAAYYLEKDAYYEGNEEGTYNVRVRPNANGEGDQQWTAMPEGGTFANNTNITSVTFDKGVKLTKYCYDTIPYMFYNCTSLEKVTNLLGSSSPYNYDSAFEGCVSLKEVSLNDDMILDLVVSEYSNGGIFANCGADEVTITVATWSIHAGKTIEKGNTILKIVASEELSKTIDGLEGWEAYITGTDIVLTKYIGTDTEVVVPATYYLAKDAYYLGNAAGTYNIKIKPNLMEGADRYSGNPGWPYADGGIFANTNITSVEFERGVQLIDNCYNAIPYMFTNCTSLRKVTNLLGGSLYQGAYNNTPAFVGCTALEEVSFLDDNAVDMVDYLFKDCGADEVKIIVSTDSQSVGETIKVDNTTLNIVANGEIKKVIDGVEDWEAYISGTDIVLTKYIGTDTEVVVPATYYLAKDAYYKGNTAGTYNVVLQPNSTSYKWPIIYTVKEEGGLFAGNTNITSVTFETGVTVLRDCYYGLPYMFANCTSLTTVNNLPSISYACEEGPFKNCTSLKEITLMNESNVMYAEWYLFRDCGSSAVTVKVPMSSSYVGQTYTVGDTTVTIVGY